MGPLQCGIRRISYGMNIEGFHMSIDCWLDVLSGFPSKMGNDTLHKVDLDLSIYMSHTWSAIGI